MKTQLTHTDKKLVFLRLFSKITCYATVILIFIGGLVTSTGSGLSVPDWPLSYGMVFPPMVGGVLYEHGHRMAATTVGFFMLCLAIALKKWEGRCWIRRTAYAALTCVILQGLLGGMTVLLFLPPPVSVLHGVIAQTFFILTVFLAYSLSFERLERQLEVPTKPDSRFLRINVFFIVCLFIQLILGAVMRHTHSGLAIPDFPTIAGRWWPLIDSSALAKINTWRFEMDLDPVTKLQVYFHLLHRIGAMIVFTVLIFLNIAAAARHQVKNVQMTLILIDILVGLQILLGAFVIWTQKEPYLTSLHVFTGAGILGLSVLLFLRAAPLKLKEFKKAFLPA